MGTRQCSCLIYFELFKIFQSNRNFCDEGRFAFFLFVASLIAASRLVSHHTIFAPLRRWLSCARRLDAISLSFMWLDCFLFIWLSSNKTLGRPCMHIVLGQNAYFNKCSTIVLSFIVFIEKFSYIAECLTRDSPGFPYYSYFRHLSRKQPQPPSFLVSFCCWFRWFL